MLVLRCGASASSTVPSQIFVATGPYESQMRDIYCAISMLTSAPDAEVPYVPYAKQGKVKGEEWVGLSLTEYASLHEVREELDGQRPSRIYISPCAKRGC